MSEAGINTEELVPVSNVSKSRESRLARWFRKKFGKKRQVEPKMDAPQRTEIPLPIAGGATGGELQPEGEKGEWRTDTTDRLDRAEPIGTNRITAGDRAAAVGVIGDPKKSDIDTRLGESLEALSVKAAAEQRRIKDEREAKSPAPKPFRSGSSERASMKPLLKRTA